MKLTGILATSVITALALGPGYSAQVQAPPSAQIQNPTEMVIAGDPKRIKEVTDIWTFAREVASRDPNWKLIATQAAN